MFMPVRDDRARPKVYKPRINREEISNPTYRKLFRFDKQNVEWLAQTFLPENHETRGGCLSPTERMESTLHYLADPGYQTSVAQVMGVTQPTVCRCVASTINMIADQHPAWIKFPVSEEDVNAAKQRWSEKHGFPFTIGAIDCTHVRIDKPHGQFGDEFINRKNFPSFNVQATCDEKFVFTSVDVGWPGSVHDSRIFQTSEVHNTVSTNVNGFLLGDTGYGIAPYLMRPYSNPATPSQRIFNRLLSSNRVVIEQSFGQMKRRFPILKYGIRLKIDNIPKCIMTCFVLHNVSKFLNDPDDDLQEDDGDMVGEEEDVANDAVNNPQPSMRITRRRGQQRRDEIAALLFERP